MSTTPMVKAEAVHKSYGRLEVLRGIDLEVYPKEVMCMIGPSGSGKSTFLRCINHLEKIDAGRLSVDGDLVGYRQRGDKLHELADREICRKRSEIGMVFQRFNLFPHMTALENIVEGFAFVRNTGPVRAILLLLGVVSFVGMPYAVLMPVFADKILHGGARGLGILMGATGVGAQPVHGCADDHCGRIELAAAVPIYRLRVNVVRAVTGVARVGVKVSLAISLS